MARSANRTTYPVETPRSFVQILYANFVGGGAGNCTLSTQEALNGEIISVTRTGVGTYNIVFRYGYPELKHAPNFTFVGVSQNMNGRTTAFDVVNATATFVFCIGTTPTDIPTTDTAYVKWAVRNSGKNK